MVGVRTWELPDQTLTPNDPLLPRHLELHGKFHQSPPSHQAFEGHHFVICNFVRCEADHHELAVPVPYYHSNVDPDEIMFYVDGDDEARESSGIAKGSLSIHPGGHPHGPQSGAIEASIGTEYFDETAVMVDTLPPLDLGEAALATDDGIHAPSWTGGRWITEGADDRTPCRTGRPGRVRRVLRRRRDVPAPLEKAVTDHAARWANPLDAAVGPAVLALKELPEAQRVAAGLEGDGRAIEAVRYTNPATGFTHHGFLNIAMATEAARAHEPAERVARLLTDTDPEPLVELVKASDGSWHESFVSVGTHSVGEPAASPERLGIFPHRLT